MLVLALAAPAFGFSPSAGGLSSAPRVARHAEPRLAFKNAQSTDTAVKDQLARAQAAGLTPIEYEKATRATATAYLAESGAHVADASTSDGPRQTAAFLKQLWGVDSVPAVPAAQLADETRVLATLYEIGGPLTNVLSTSVAKELPLIPHLGIRVHGKEYFYSDRESLRLLEDGFLRCVAPISPRYHASVLRLTLPASSPPRLCACQTLSAAPCP